MANMKHKNKKVIVGMSGGVDSSVTAALLHKEGYEVIGITMQLLSKEAEKRSACCNLDSVTIAKRVAANLGFPHYTINSRDRFQEHVIQPFVDSYISGYTPNPCVECNRFIKFDELWRIGKSLNADFIATGHYSQIEHDIDSDVSYLKRGVDFDKDQSYFLYMLSNEQLKRILFPLGHLSKPEVKKLATSWGLAASNQEESQDICFVSDDYQALIKANIPEEADLSGFIINEAGDVLGTHDGVYQFTVGQRKGIGVSGTTEPLYVCRIDAKTKHVVVGPKASLYEHEVVIEQLSFTNPNEVLFDREFDIQLRYRSKAAKGRIISIENDEATLRFQDKKSALSPGQTCVIYDNNRVIGGGIIK